MDEAVNVGEGGEDVLKVRGHQHEEPNTGHQGSQRAMIGMLPQGTHL